MTARGRHLLVEYHGCCADTLDAADGVEKAMNAAAGAAGATVISSAFHRFPSGGISGVVLLAESHLSIHTWPASGYAAVDFYTCGDCEPDRAHVLLAAALGASSAEVLRVDRGLEGAGPSMRLVDGGDGEKARGEKTLGASR